MHRKFSMKNGLLFVVTLAALAACQKKTEEAPPANTSSSTATVAQAPVEPAEPTKADRERAEKQAALDYATMEDSYLNDPKGQWAKAATASSTFGETSSNGPSDINAAK